MNPNTRLSAFFNDINRVDATRQVDFHQALDQLDAFMNEAPRLPANPAVSAGISGGRCRAEESMAHVAISGDVTDVRITTPYDLQRHPDDPAVVMASQILAFTVTRKEPGGLIALMEGGSRRKKAGELREPSARYYMFSLRYDGIQHHTARDESGPGASTPESTAPQTRNETTETAPAVAAAEATSDPGSPSQEASAVATDMQAGLALNAERFRHPPALDSFKLGIVRRGGEICLFTLVENENHGDVIPVMKGAGSIFSSDNSPTEFGPVDHSYWRIQPVVHDKDLAILDVMGDIQRLTDGFTPTEAPARRGFFRRGKSKDAAN